MVTFYLFMNNVICVYWGTKYPIKYVNVLYNMVKRNLTLPFNFYCLIDDIGRNLNSEIKKIAIPNPQLQHWWNKMHLYNSELKINGNILYIDLDTVIINNINDFFTYGDEQNFCVIKDFGQPQTTINSSILRYNLKYHSHIWQTYIDRKQQYDQTHGDQNVITSMMFKHKQTVFFPDEWTYSFKWPERGKPEKFETYKPEKYFIRKDKKICVFHGHPNPDYIVENHSDSWVKDYWK